MKLKFLKFIAPIAALAAVPIISTACSQVYSTKLTQITAANWESSENGKNLTYSQLSDSSVTVKDAIYGSNYNNGNYIFLYGTTGSEASSPIADLLYGTTGNDGTGNIVVDMDKNLNFSTSTFLSSFFNNGNGEQTGGLGSSNSIVGFSVSLLMFIDFAPYNGDASSTNGKSGADSPLAQYTQDEVLAELNKDGIKYTLENMPNEAKAKIGTYKRNDQSAIEYRYLLNYMKAVRPGAANTTDTYGLIAFKKDKAPQTFSISDASSLSSNLLSYYQSSN